MSQAKVDKYKEDKKNRKKIMAKEKREWFLTQLLLIVAGIVIVAWVAIGAFQAIRNSAPAPVVEPVTYTIDNTAIEDYLDALEEL